MKDKVVPALLSNKVEGYESMINLCKSFTKYVQIDLMDGQFVNSKSMDPVDLKRLNSHMPNEAHLMVKNPLNWLDSLETCETYKVIFHYEINVDHKKIIDEVKTRGFNVGIAINPDTGVEKIEDLIGILDSVLFMSVEPGRYAAPFIPRVLDKIGQFRKKFPNFYVGIDGGIKLSNLQDVIESGVNYVCVGSAILKAENPKEEYLKFKNALDGI